MTNTQTAALLAGIWSLPLLTAAAEPLTNPPGQPPALEITITGPLRALSRDRADEPEERPGRLMLVDGTLFEVGLRPRGKSRRRTSSCAFPPLWVNFRKDDIENTALAGHDKRKLVTHCSRLSTRPRDESKLHLEMLAYRLFNLLAEPGFRVQPLAITYIEDQEPDVRYQHAGFFIEHKKSLARRYDAELLDRPTLQLRTLDAPYANMVALFNLLIGNPDFSLIAGPPGEDCCHNAVPMALKDGRLLSVPYDFDNTGLVDPPYAAPPASLSISNVRQRIYRGYCRHNDQIAANMAALTGQREAIRSMFRTEPALSDRERKRVLKYIDQFFQRYGDAKGQSKYLTRKCLGPSR